MSDFLDWARKKKKEEGGAKKEVNTFSEKGTFLEWAREKKYSSSIDAWGKGANDFAAEIQEKYKTWYVDDDYYNSSSERASNILYYADNWRKQYAGNKEALEYIDNVVKLVQDTQKYAESYHKYYSQFDSEDSRLKYESDWLNPTVGYDHEKIAERQGIYEKNKARISEIDEILKSRTLSKEEKNKLKDERAQLEAQNRQYDRTQGRADSYAYVLNEDGYDDVYNRLNFDNTFHVGSYELKEKPKLVKGKDGSLYTEGGGLLRPGINELAGDKSSGGEVPYWKQSTLIDDESGTGHLPGSKGKKGVVAGAPEKYDYGHSIEGMILALQDGGEIGEDGKVRDKYGAVMHEGVGELSKYDKLGVYLSANKAGVREKFIREAYDPSYTWELGNLPTDWSALMGEGDNASWLHMTEDEIGIYYYLLEKDKDKAYQYLEDIKPELNRREMAEETEHITEIFNDAGLVGKGVLNAVSIPVKAIGNVWAGAEDVYNIVTGQDINPYSQAHSLGNFSSTVRGLTEDEIEEWSGGIKIPILDYTLGDAYQGVMSAGDMLTAYITGPHLYAAQMGLGAFSDTATDLYLSGASDEQIFGLGAIAGVAEGFFEKFSIEKLIDIGDTKTLGQFFKNIALQGGIEASEEAATEFANLVADGFIRGGTSQWNQWLEESNGNALLAVGKGMQQIGKAGMSGFIAGAMGGGGASGASLMNYNINTNSQGRAILENQGYDGLRSLAEVVAAENAGSKGGEAISKALRKADAKTSAKNVGRLADTVNTTARSAQASAIQQALEGRGIDRRTAAQTADALIDIATKEANGIELSDADYKVINQNKVTYEVYNDVLEGTDSVSVKHSETAPSDNASDAVLNEIAKGNSKRGLKVNTGVVDDAVDHKVDHKVDQKVDQVVDDADSIIFNYTLKGDYSEAAKKKLAEDLARVESQRASAVSEEVPAKASKTMTAEDAKAYKGKTTYTNPDTGETQEINITGISSIENGEMMLKLDNGESVSYDDVRFSSEGEALVYSSVLDLGANAGVAEALVKNFKDAGYGEKQAGRYALGIADVYNYGAHNIPISQLLDTSLSNALSQEQREYIYKLGQSEYEARRKAEKAQQKASEAKVAEAKEKGEFKHKEGQIIVESSVAVDENGNIDESGLNDMQKANLHGIIGLAKLSPINYHIFRSKKINGKFVAIINGVKYENSPNGIYRAGTNDIWIDLNAGNDGEGAMIRTGTHEISHYIKERSPDDWQEMADFLIGELSKKKGKAVSYLLNNQVAKIKARSDAGTKTETQIMDEAYEELVCDALCEMLIDGTVVESLAKLKQENKSIWEKIKEAIEDLLKRWGEILGVYKGRGHDTAEAQMLSTMQDAFNTLQEMYGKAFAKANEIESIGERNLEDFAEAKNTDGEPLFQYRAMEADEATYREMLSKWGGMNNEQINNLFSTIDKAMEIIKANLEVLDYAWEADINDRAFLPVKPNSDKLYKVSLDFSTLCRKRLLQQTIIAELQAALDKPLSREEGIAIRDALMALQEEGRKIEVACALCYVESARMKSPKQIEKFLKNREKVLREFFASKSGGDIKAKIKQAEADMREKLGVGNKALKSMSKKDADAIRQAKKDAKASYAPTKAEAELIHVAKEMTVSDFTSPEGLEDLAKNYPMLFDAYTSYVRNATKSKGIENDTWWRAGDSSKIGDVLIANMNRENGLRSQSWSDFQVIHILDYIAATIELSTRNAKEQAYSKVPDYVELMGQTGVMINMSLIPARKFNGTLQYDSTEGMDYNRALELRKKYPATAGTICIGIDNKQIQMLLADINIDYVIPYHRSGMAASIRKLMHIPSWSEFEKYQGETKLSDAEAKKNAQKYGVKLLDKSDPNYHKGTSFSEWFDLEVAKQIAEMENKNPSDPKKQKEYGVMYGGYMAMQNAANNYLKLCAERGLAPKFSHEKADFTAEDNYWKLLIDRKMVNNKTGEIIEQQTIKPVFEEGEVLRILNDELKRYPGVKEDQDYAVRKVTENFLSGNIKSGMSAEAIAKVMKKPVDNVTKTNIMASAEDVTVKDKPVMKHSDRNTTKLDRDYLSAVERGDMETAQKLVDEAAREAGYRIKGHHGTGVKFTVFDISKTSDANDFGQGFYFSSSEIEAERYQKDDTHGDTYNKIYGVAYDNALERIEEMGEDANDEMLFDRVFNEEFDKELARRTKDGAIISAYLRMETPFIVSSSNWITESEAIEIARNTMYVEDVPDDISISDWVQSIKTYAKQHDGKIDTDYFANKAGHALQLTNALLHQGKYDGVLDYTVRDKFDSTSDYHAIALNPNQIKDSSPVTYDDNGNVIPLSERFKKENPDIRYSERNKAPTFYSHMGKVVDGIKTEKVGANGVVPYLKGKGVKNEEIKWSGIEAFLEGKKSVTKAELQEFIAGSMLQIGEEMSDPTRWSQYKLDGGENYRELVFKMPNSTYTNRAMKAHWGTDAEGVLAHARIQDFNAPEGKMLFIEEIQSDWHNEGHKKGYADESKKLTVDNTEIRHENGWYKLYHKGEALHQEISEAFLKQRFRNGITEEQIHEGLVNEYNESISRKNGADLVPDAPFKDNYHEFVLKRLIRMAAEEGYDSIGWTTAQIQSDRWSDEYAEGYRIEYDQDTPKFMNKYGKKWGAKVGKTKTNEDKSLPGYVGDSNAKKFSSPEEAVSFLESLGFTIRSTENRAYGRVYTTYSILNPYRGWGTQYGVKQKEMMDYASEVRKEGIQKKNVHEVWSMPITDSMKQSVLYEGQALYSERNTDSNRSLLANALESAAVKPEEKNLLRNYKTNIRLIEAEREKLSKIQQKLRGDISSKQRKELQAEANQIASRINDYDRKLLELEAMKPIKDVLKRERSLAAEGQKQKNEKILKEYKQKVAESRRTATEGRHKTVMKHKIKGVISELNQLFTRGNKEKHVKKGLRETVATAIASAELIFSDDISNEMIMRNGFRLPLSAKENGYADEYMQALQEIDEYKSALEKLKDSDEIGKDQKRREYLDAMWEQKRKLKNLDKKLSDAFERERIAYNRITTETILKELANVYAKTQNADEDYLRASYDDFIRMQIENLAEYLSDEPTVRDMSLDSLQKVYRAYRMVLTAVKKANTTFKAGKAESISTLGNNTRAEIEQVGGSKTHVIGGKLGSAISAIKSFDVNNLKPVHFFKRLGSKTLSMLYENVRKGEDTWAIDITEAKKFKEEVTKKYGADKWDYKKVYTFKSSTGKEFTLTLEQMMSLYAYSKRDQAIPHLEKGGFVFDGAIETYKEKENGKKSILKYRVNTATAHKITQTEVDAVIAELGKIKGAIKYVDEMQDYLSTVMGAKGNEVSMEMYGVDLFNEKFYFPLKSAKQYMFEQNEVAGEVKIKNSSFSKETKKFANNPIILSNFMDVWASHVNDMSMYHAFVLPLEDFNRVYNYSTPASESLDTVSVKQTIQNAYETQANQYISQLLKDLNGGARVDPRGSTSRKLVGMFKKAKVFASASVVIQQPSAVARALALIDAKYFDFNPKLIKHKQYWEELKKYAPVAIIKEMGHFDTDMGMSSVDYIRGDKTVMNVVDDIISKPAAYMDELTWVHIWTAVKRETMAKNKGLRGEALLKKSGERFTEVITQTQVYDSVLSRSANMRSKDGLVNMLTSFMAEPTTSINMLENAVVDFSRGERGKASRAVASVAASVVLNSLLVSFVYAARDDDEDETYWEKYLGSLTSEIVDGINPITYYPILKDIWSVMQGYEVKRSDMTLIDDLVSVIKDGITLLAKDTGDMDEEELAEHKKEVVSFWHSAAGKASSLVGLPVDNIIRDVKAVFNVVETAKREQKTSGSLIGDEVLESIKGTVPVWGWFPNKSKQDKLYDAIVSGDKAYINRLKSGYKNDTAYINAVSKALRENDPRIREAAEARLKGDNTGYKQIVLKIKGEGHFSQDEIIRAINSEMNALEKGESSSGITEKPMFTNADYYRAALSGDSADVNAVKEYLIESGKKESNIESSFNSSVKDAYEQGEIDSMKAISLMVEYGGKTSEEANISVKYVDFKAEYPDYADSISESRFAKYYEPIDGYYGYSLDDMGISVEVYADYCERTSGIEGVDNDGDGKLDSGSKKRLVMQEIDALPLTTSQKDALYFLNGWSKNTLYEAPWR